MATHDSAMVDRMRRRVIELERGRTVVEGLPEVRPGDDLAAMLARQVPPLPVLAYDRQCKGAKAYMELAGETLRRAGITTGETA